MIIGPNRSGKTSLKKLLIGEKFYPEEDSTQGIKVGPSLCKMERRFEKAIQSLCADGFKLLKLSQAKEIAQNVCGISDGKEFHTLLNSLHDNKMLIHFDEPKELSNLIILDIQRLIDVFKRVITIVPIECQNRTFRKDWQRLETDGVLTKKLAVHVWKDMTQETETVDGFLSVMEKFSLLCRWPTDDGEELYLVPSMLKWYPKGKFYSTELGSDAPPLFVRFTEDQIPVGLFPRLLIHFVHWCSEKWSKKNQPRLFCNIARFYIGDSGEYSVVVASHQSIIKITILKEEAKQSFSKNCSVSMATIFKELKGFLEQTLSSMGKEFPWMNTEQYEFCVRCTVCSTQICRQHNVPSCTQDICQCLVSEEELRKSLEESIKLFDFLKDEEKETDLKRREMEILSAAEPDVVQQDVFTYAQAVTLYGQNAVGDIFPTIMNDLRLPVPANYTPEQLVSEGAIALTQSEMEEFISTSSAHEIVNTLADRLNVDYKKLEEPDSQTCRIVRCFSHCVRASGRTDVLQAMKRRLRAGTAGPLLPEDTLVRNLPYLTLSKLGIALSGGEEWKQLAEYLGMSSEEIRFLDKRKENPGAFILECLASLNVTVGQLYDFLRYCGLESFSEKL